MNPGNEGRTWSWFYGQDLVEKCLEAGMTVSAGRLLDGDTRLTRRILASGDVQELAWLDRMRLKLSELREHEAINGPHSAIMKDHPFVVGVAQTYAANGLVWPPSR